MLTILIERLRQGMRTTDYPLGPAPFPERWRGRPRIDASKCPDGCDACAEACPTGAIEWPKGAPRIDLGRCLFCTACVEACPPGAVTYTRDPALATRTREDLVVRGDERKLAAALDEKMLSLFGRSLRLRQVCAGGCNGCEAELMATGNVIFDLSRFGIQFVASPRHADGLVITGPVTDNMKSALLETYEAVPPPRLVIAVGACAISGGPLVGSTVCNDGVGALVPVDLFIPGCPPHPITVLDGLLRLLGRMPAADPQSL
ncbi:MAG TPA: 4Fe-4S dicluster domain-containing protein [Planctomycetota bacterium]|nr:4Fe-4S dicluster domain-containing protein [Planctomycetota bacterium]